MRRRERLLEGERIRSMMERCRSSISTSIMQYSGVINDHNR